MEEVLYRKYRPQIFDDVKGQDLIVKALKNQVRYNRISHAFLFSGIRGTGKTTVARIFARAINCENPQNGNPCNVCSTCKSILNDVSLNVVEWDAAVYGKPTDMHRLQEMVSARPINGRYKVFIIDETQEMRAPAVSMFLKTLEEPPEHAVFILATTEPKNIPDALRSRCQKYVFNRMSIELIKEQLRGVLTLEGRTMEEKGVLHLAHAADGSMRDALTLLNYVLTFSTDTHITYETILNAVGAMDRNFYDALVKLIYERDAGEVLKKCDKALSTGMSEEQLVAEILQYIRDLLMVKNNMEEEIQATDEQIAHMKTTAAEMDMDRLEEMMLPLGEILNRFRYDTSKRMALEIAIIAICSDAAHAFDEIEKRVSTLEKVIGEQ